MRTHVLALLAASMLGGASASAGIIYGFAPVTNNNLADVAAGMAQLSVEVDPDGPNKVKFTFRNNGPTPMSITDVYFDDGTLLGIAAIVGMPGVDFGQNAAPPNLPGGNLLTPAFQTTAGFSADSNPPVQPNGVNPGEELIIRFGLISGQGYDDTITALNTPGDKLRIGIHVQGFAGGGSESFIHVVPSPGALALLVGAGVLSRRRRR